MSAWRSRNRSISRASASPAGAPPPSPSVPWRRAAWAASRGAATTSTETGSTGRRTQNRPPGAADAAERFFATIGKHTTWVQDAPGLVLGRIVCQVINEAAFALGEGVGSTTDIDPGMVHGLSHPRGPMEWADLIGLDHVLSVLD